MKRIVLFDTLLETNSRGEILAILAHEAGHWKKKHIIKKLVAMEIFAFVGLYLIFLLVQGNGLPDLFGIEFPTVYVKFFLVGFVGSLLSFPLQPIFHYVSRRQEKEADDYAVQLTGDPQSLASSLVNLGRDNLSNLHPHPLYAAFYYSHPPLVERVARLRGMG